ncbi:hypothetical protein [Pseudomonas aeruginosa]|jgi:hypothetical protein|nr:hypothetical protein [Pseudomonas aeruginosa]
MVRKPNPKANQCKDNSSPFKPQTVGNGFGLKVQLGRRVSRLHQVLNSLV